MRASPTVTDQARELAIAFHEALRCSQLREDANRVCDWGITVTECHALEVVALEGPLSVNAIAERLRLDKSTVSRVVAALVEQGHLRSAPDPADARGRRVSTTVRGRRLSESILEATAARAAAVLRDYTPRERAAAIEILRRISARDSCEPRGAGVKPAKG